MVNKRAGMGVRHDPHGFFLPGASHPRPSPQPLPPRPCDVGTGCSGESGARFCWALSKREGCLCLPAAGRGAAGQAPLGAGVRVPCTAPQHWQPRAEAFLPARHERPPELLAAKQATSYFYLQTLSNFV